MDGRLILILGDVITIAVVTVIGFASHGTAGSAGLRMLTTFIPLLVSWFLVAPFLGAYDPQRVKDIRQVWRPFWAMVLVGPFASWMRGAWLNAPILPLFVVILGGTGALAILTWRVLYYFLITRKS